MVFVIKYLYPTPQHVVLTRLRRAGGSPFPPVRWVGTIQDAACELRRRSLLGTWVNSPCGRHERFESMLTKSDLPED
jgi:hypothetical protein